MYVVDFYLPISSRQNGRVDFYCRFLPAKMDESIIYYLFNNFLSAVETMDHYHAHRPLQSSVAGSVPEQ